MNELAWQRSLPEIFLNCCSRLRRPGRLPQQARSSAQWKSHTAAQVEGDLRDNHRLNLALDSSARRFPASSPRLETKLAAPLETALASLDLPRIQFLRAVLFPEYLQRRETPSVVPAPNADTRPFVRPVRKGGSHERNPIQQRLLPPQQDAHCK